MSGAGQHARIFNALRAANVPEREASDALLAIREDMRSVKADITELKSDVRLLKWQVGVCIGLMLAVLALLLRLMFRLGAL